MCPAKICKLFFVASMILNNNIFLIPYLITQPYIFNEENKEQKGKEEKLSQIPINVVNVNFFGYVEVKIKIMLSAFIYLMIKSRYYSCVYKKVNFIYSTLVINIYMVKGKSWIQPRTVYLSRFLCLESYSVLLFHTLFLPFNYITNISFNW